MPHYPTIVNQTEHTIVVFQERGILFNKQVLLPGEAVNITRFQNGSLILPYFIHAAVGDERHLPTRQQSINNLVKSAAIPATFAVGAMAAIMSAGVLSGPSMALAPLVSGMVVQGMVIDTAAIAAGTVMATRAIAVSQFLVKKYPEKFMCKSQRLSPGKRFIVVTGGLETPLVMHTDVKESEFNKLHITAFKEPTDTVMDKVQHYTGMGGGGKTDPKETRNDTENRIEA